MVSDRAPVGDPLEQQLRAMRPEIDREFATKLDAWAADGFPARGQSPATAGKARRRAPRLRLTLPRLAFAACMILIVGTVSVGALQNLGSVDDESADAKAELDALVERLGEASSADEIAQIREQLQIARSELASARSDLATLKQRTDFSTLAVTITGDGDSDGWSLGDAADDAGSVLGDMAGAALVTLAAIVPLALMAFGGWFLYTRIRRSRRDKMLDR